MKNKALNLEISHIKNFNRKPGNPVLSLSLVVHAELKTSLYLH